MSSMVWDIMEAYSCSEVKTLVAVGPGAVLVAHSSGPMEVTPI